MKIDLSILKSTFWILVQVYDYLFERYIYFSLDARPTSRKYDTSI
jgi:hypothetical protein